MKSSSIRHLFAIAVLLAVSAAPLPAADATYGNLTVTGTADFGTWSEGDNGPGLTLNYTDGATAAVNFIGSGSAVIWQWGNFNGSQNANSMTLDQNNQLLLYSGTTAGITLNPSGASAFAGSVTISGTDNELPNQVLISGSSILTQGLADGRYLSLSAASSYVTQTAANANYVQSVKIVRLAWSREIEGKRIPKAVETRLK